MTTTMSHLAKNKRRRPGGEGNNGGNGKENDPPPLGTDLDDKSKSKQRYKRRNPRRKIDDYEQYEFINCLRRFVLKSGLFKETNATDKAKKYCIIGAVWSNRREEHMFWIRVKRKCIILVPESEVWKGMFIDCVNTFPLHLYAFILYL